MSFWAVLLPLPLLELMKTTRLPTDSLVSFHTDTDPPPVEASKILSGLTRDWCRAVDSHALAKEIIAGIAGAEVSWPFSKF
jgi:hypothetical protein